MKMLYGIAATVLLLVSMFFATLPDTAQAEGITLSAMTTIKQKADKALITAKGAQERSRRHDNSGKPGRHLTQLYNYAESNALVAAYYLQLLQAGEEVFVDDAHDCDTTAGLLLKALGFLDAGNLDQVEHLIIIISVHIGRMPTAKAAAIVQIKIEIKGSSHNSRDFLIIVINTRKHDGSVIIIVPGGGGNGDGHGGGGDGHGGGGDGHGGGGGDEEDCYEKGRVEISRQCRNGRVVITFEVTYKCEIRKQPVRNYKKTITVEGGPCCTMDSNCDDHNPCTEDKCWQGICFHTKIHHPSPHHPHQCRED